MKTTIELPDELFARAKRHAKKTGRPLRALVEEGLRLALEAENKPKPYVMPDMSVGRRGDPNPLENYTWEELRDEIYGGR